LYKVYGKVFTRTFRVLWLLEELGVSYELIDSAPQSEDVRRLNPLGKVPVVMDGDAVLSDSVAIMTYLADKHGQFTYAAGTVERARQDAMTLMLIDDFDALLWAASRHSFVLPEDKRVSAIKPSLAWEFQRNADRIADLIQGPFLMGEAMTIADILCVHCLNWSVSAKFSVENRKLLDYAKSLRNRDAYKRVQALAKT
jgi:glutathione S-transferase